MSDKSATLENGLVRIDFPYDPRIVSDLKERFENAVFDRTKKCWYIDPDSVPTNALYLFFKKWYIIPESNLVDKIEDERNRRKRMLVKSMQTRASKDIDFPHPAGLSFFPFQEACIEFIIRNHGNVLVADECGLGKTIEVLGYARKVIHLPMLVVCPVVAKVNWLYESMRWLEIPENKIRIIGQGFAQPTVENLEGKKVIITNYELVEKYSPIFDELPIKLLVADECQYLKNYKSKRSKAIVALSQGIDDALCLSGTPLTNKPIELFPILQVLKRDKGDFSFWNFTKKYCDAKKKWVPAKGGGKEIYDTSGASNLDDLNEKLRKNVMIRRYASDVYKELPPMHRMMVRIDLGEKIYRKFKSVEEDFINYYEQTKGKILEKGKKLVFIETMRKLSAKGKIDQALEFIVNLYQSVNKVIVFAHHQEVLDAVEKAFKEKTTVLRIDGETPNKKRVGYIDTFNALDDVILVASITTMSTSINLQTCSNVVFIEVTWVPADHQQAEARVHRIGQKNISNIYYLIADKTIEERIFDVIDKKDRIVKKVLK